MMRVLSARTPMQPRGDGRLCAERAKKSVRARKAWWASSAGVWGRYDRLMLVGWWWGGAG
eukprot:scaffold3743_cov63-Phaeocystis_antarctica.AAC.3